REPLGERLGQVDEELATLGAEPALPLPLDDLHVPAPEFHPLREVADAVGREVVDVEGALAGDEVVVGPGALAGAEGLGAAAARAGGAGRARIGGVALGVHVDDLLAVGAGGLGAGGVAEGTLDGVGDGGVGAALGLALDGALGPALGGVADAAEDALGVGGWTGDEQEEER